MQDKVEKGGYSTTKPLKHERLSYDMNFKLVAIKCAKEKGNKAAARQFDVTPKMIRDWRSKEAKLLNACATRRAFRGPKSGKWPELERRLAQWVRDVRAQLCSVSKKMMQREARKLVKELGIPGNTFRASLSWINRVMKRNGLSIRRRTTIAQRLPVHYEEKLLSFQRYVIALRKRNNYLLSHIGNADQTPLYSDMPRRTTINEKGKKTIRMKTTGNEKTRFTVMLIITADGRKLPPYVVYKRKTILKGNFPLGAHVRAHETGTFTEDITSEWLGTVWARRPGALLNKQSMLVLDSFRVHLTDHIKAQMQRHKPDLVIIPGGMTSILQPLDVSVNKPFKNKIEDYYNDWMLSGVKQYTPSGSIRRPDPVLVDWVQRAWNSIPENIIRKSFLKCSISNALDGIEDDYLWQDSDDEDDPDYDENSAAE
ncbi:Pogo transposable element with KRAB domain [Frankliniella fusca]|uniref:Pogo transposable element with KRAB domain n=1 Tax=Frankliniella fusca TaxID=407009 RepID=A0AAE1HHT2_9NEOP|nr:Pogo transposable element with KRAB domain [Frankliniella fusca]